MKRVLSALALLPALAAGGCDQLEAARGQALCTLAPKTIVEQALGAPLHLARAEKGADAPTCVWTAGGADETPPRALSATVWRSDSLHNGGVEPMSSALYFEDRLHELEVRSGQTRPLGGIGDAAVIGFGQIGDERFTGGLVARKGKAVLVMRISGADPAAFEAAARAIVLKL